MLFFKTKTPHAGENGSRAKRFSRLNFKNESIPRKGEVWAVWYALYAVDSQYDM